MLKGLENVFKVGVEYGAKIALDSSKQTSNDIEVSSVLSLEDRKSNE